MWRYGFSWRATKELTLKDYVCITANVNNDTKVAERVIKRSNTIVKKRKRKDDSAKWWALVNQGYNLE